MAVELKESVTDFKLPEEVQSAAAEPMDDFASQETEEFASVADLDTLDEVVDEDDVATLDDEVVDLSMDDAYTDDVYEQGGSRA